MGQTLTNGIFLPDEGERNCYTGLAENWRALDYLIGGYNVHVADAVIHVTQADRNKWDAVTGKADASALTTHTGDNTIHVTAADKAVWNGKANDTDVMHLTGDETAAGEKIFSDMSSFQGSYLGNEGSTNARTCTYSFCNRDTKDYSGIYQRRVRQNRAQGSMSGSDISQYAFDVLENQVRTNNVIYFVARDFVDDIPQTVYLTSQCANRYFGSSNYPLSNVFTNQINSKNPGALSLPNLSAGVDISAYITNLTGASNINKFTPTADGWISIGLSSADFIEIYIPDYLMGGTFTKSTVNGNALAFMPVIANKEVKIALKGSSILLAKFYPCQGNT